MSMSMLISDEQIGGPYPYQSINGGKFHSVILFAEHLKISATRRGDYRDREKLEWPFLVGGYRKEECLDRNRRLIHISTNRKNGNVFGS